MKARCSIEIEYPGESALDAAMKAVSHEGGLSERSKASVRKEGTRLVISIEARDIVALRATMNAFMRALQVFEGLEEKEEQAD